MFALINLYEVSTTVGGVFFTKCSSRHHHHEFGLHDGHCWPNTSDYIEGANYVAAFWAKEMEGVWKRGLVRPEIIYRTTVATAGFARKKGYNPHKMEAFNALGLDKFRQHRVLDRGIDDFDITYPWDYTIRQSDGIHCGRAPWKQMWRDGQIGHQYFVDLMLCRVDECTLSGVIEVIGDADSVHWYFGSHP